MCGVCGGDGGVRPDSTAEYETSGGDGKQKKQAEAFSLESETTFFWKKQTNKPNVFLHGDVKFELESVTLYLCWLFQMFMELNCEKKD